MSNSNPEMSYTTYKRVIGATRCTNGLRGFRVNIRRFSIQKLRVRFIHFFKMLFKWRKSYDRAIHSFKEGISGGRTNNRRNNNNNNSNNSNSNSSSDYFTTNYNQHNHIYSKRRLITEQKKPAECRLRSLGRSNSFYSEAIADCLEFIKRNSLSVDDINHVHDDEVAPITAHATSLR